MDEGTKEMIQGIIKQAKILEQLMTELESPLNDVQQRNLRNELFCMESALCYADCIHDVVSRIDNALHHPEAYPEPEPEPPYDGSAEAVHNRLCKIRDTWKDIFYPDSIDKRKHAFLIAHMCFADWTKEIFSYTEYLGVKYGLIPSQVKIGGASMKDLGVYNDRTGAISYNRRLVRDPAYAIITVIHELSHISFPNHSRQFWQLYEDICINEGILLERVLGGRKSLREIKKEDIPYLWKPETDYFTDNEIITIEKSLKMSDYGVRKFSV